MWRCANCKVQSEEWKKRTEESVKENHILTRLYQIRSNHATTTFSDSMSQKYVTRNNGVLLRSDYVVTYIAHSWGGAYRCAEKVGRQKKVVINL